MTTLPEADLRTGPAAPHRRADAPLLEVENLSVAFGARRVVRGVSFAVDPGEAVVLVGESGSGKSVTALSVLRLLPSNGANPEGRVALDGCDVLRAPEPVLRRLRGRSEERRVGKECRSRWSPYH